jgi:hypothetical protein
MTTAFRRACVSPAKSLAAVNDFAGPQLAPLNFRLWRNDQQLNGKNAPDQTCLNARHGLIEEN